jgi:peptidoglycan/xylan/chitin deacetylase (PgdA/CDA1 family)
LDASIEALSLSKSLARAGLHRLGGIQVFRNLTRNSARILMYHRFPADREMFRNQCKHLRQYYHPVSMRQVAAAANGGEPLPAYAVAITVDDGYRDFLLHAHPALCEFEIPATVFLVSDFIDGKGMLWWDRLVYAFRNTNQDAVSLDFNGETRTLLLDRNRSREQARALVAELKLLPHKERTAIVDRVVAALGVNEPETPTPEFAGLTWEDVRTLAKNNVEFGAHTRTHPILSTLANREETLSEIGYSRDRVAAELNAPVLHFCYPNGKDDDIGEEAVRVTRECGFQTAVTTTPGTNRIAHGADPWRLKRLGVPFDLPPYYFAELLAGVRNG